MGHLLQKDRVPWRALHARAGHATGVLHPSARAGLQAEPCPCGKVKRVQHAAAGHWLAPDAECRLACLARLSRHFGLKTLAK
jgi:hypothetical protein